MKLHPISQIFYMRFTEKETIASKENINRIKGDFNFEPDEIDMISMQLNNHLHPSKIIPENRFNVEFNVDNLKKILENKETMENVLLILLSCISWLINVEKKLDANNFELVLDLLDSFPDEIGDKTDLSIYKLTNYFFECILNLNIDYSFQDIENQTMRFLDRFCDKYQTDLINDTLLKWLSIGYSFEKQTVFTQSILSLTSLYAQKKSYLFTEDIFNDIYELIKRHLSFFDSFELCFLIDIAKIIPSNTLFKYLCFLFESLMPYFESKNDIQYKIFDKNQFSESIISNAIYDLPLVTSYSLQFSSFKYAYHDEIYIFPYAEVDQYFTISNFIAKIIKYLFQILEYGEIDLNQFTSLFENILNNCLKEKQMYLFDLTAAILSLIKLSDNYDPFPIFRILVDSPLFDEHLTIFTENSENESVHKIRMMSYYLLIFPSELSIQLFFSKNLKFPFMISEFFYYGSNSQKYKFNIPKDILKSELFLNQISNSLLSYINKEGNNRFLNSSSSQKISSNSSNIDSINNSSSINDSNHDINVLNESAQINNGIFDENQNIQKEDLTSNISLKESEYPNKSDNQNVVNLFDSNSTKDSLLSSGLNPNLNSSIDSFPSDDISNKDFVINESYQPNSVQIIDVSNSESSNCNYTKNYQSFQFMIQKVHHRSPINDFNNNFLKWFNAIYNNNSNKNKNIENEALTINHFLQCCLVHILVFISKTIEEDDEIASLWNESADLVPTLFSLLFNEYIRPIILDILFKIWSPKESSVTMTSQSCILTIFKQIYDDDFSLLDLQLLQTINKYLYYRMDMIIQKYHSFDESVVFMQDINLLSIIEPFNEMYPILTSILASCDISSDFLHHSMIFFSFYAKPIKKTARAAISSALSRVEGNDPNIRFFHDFILIITSFNNKDQSSEFLITQPKIVSIFIDSFSESSYLKDAFDFIESLCEKSVANALSCHAGNVDIAIIRYILKHKESNLIANALRLFSKIGLRASSISVVSQFISLFCPIKSHFSPPYISDCIQTLSSIICTKNFQPTAYLPISRKSPYIEVLKLTGRKVNQGFTFVVKLFIDKFAQKYQSKLLSIASKKLSMTISIVDDQIAIYNSLGKCFTFENQIPINNWISVAISFVPSQNVAQCHIHNHTISTIHYEFQPFGYGSILCEVGNGNTSDIFIAHATLIGSFSLYPLALNAMDNPNEYIMNSNDSENVIHKSLRNSNTSALFKFQSQDNNPWISVQFDIEQSLLHIIKSPRQSELDATLVGNNLITSLSFPDVLVKYFKAEILLPLFAQIGFPIFLNGSQIVPTIEISNSFAKSVLNLLSSTLQLSIEVQESFVQSQGFRIISHLLINILNPSILSFDFYMHFVLLFEDLSIEKLKIQLFYHILLNSDIWSLTSHDVYQQIISFWDKGLLLENQELFLLFSPLFKLIQAVSLFYQKMDSNSEEDKATRELIIQLLFDISKAKFTENDLDSLFMTCIAPPNLTLSKDLLILIRMLANLDNSPLLQFSLTKRHILFIALDALLAFHDEDLVFSTIETIFTLHKRKIIQNLKLFTHVEIIMMNIKKSLSNESFINKLIELSKNSFPEVLPIPFYLILSSLSSSYFVSESDFLINQQLLLSMIVKTLQANPKYAINKLWFLWPLIFAIKNKEITNFMLHFIILSTLKDWINIFVAIYIVASCLDIDPLPIQRNFLVILANYVIEGKVTENVNQFFELCLFFIFAKPVERKSLALRRLFTESIFYNKNDHIFYEYSAPVSSDSLSAAHHRESSSQTNNHENHENNNQVNNNQVIHGINHQENNEINNSNSNQTNNYHGNQENQANYNQGNQLNNNQGNQLNNNQGNQESDNQGNQLNNNQGNNEIKNQGNQLNNNQRNQLNNNQGNNEIKNQGNQLNNNQGNQLNNNQGNQGNNFNETNNFSNNFVNENQLGINQAENENKNQLDDDHHKPELNSHLSNDHGHHNSQESSQLSSAHLENGQISLGSSSANQSSNFESNDFMNESSDMNSEMSEHLNLNADHLNAFFDVTLFMSKIKNYSRTIFTSSKFKYMLDVNEAGKWLDLELSEYFINALNKCSNVVEVEFYVNFVNYLNNKETINSDILYDIYESRLPLINHIASLIQHISIYIIKNREDAMKLNISIKEKIDKICNDSYLYLAKVNRRSQMSKKVAHDLWSDLWRTLTNDRSPWRNSLPLSETHFKRSNRILAHFCPVKMKQNLNFTNHKDASFNREYGSSEMAKEKLINYQKELKEKIKKEAPPLLLSVSRNQEGDEEIESNSSLLNNEINLFDVQNCDFDVLNVDQEAFYYFNHCYCSDYHSSLIQQQSENNHSFDSKLIFDQKKIFDAKLLTLHGPKKIIFYVLPTHFILVYKSNDKTQMKPSKIKKIEASSVTHILYRSYLHQQKSFEIITKSGKSYLINLKNKRSLELLQKISEYSEFKNAIIQTVPPREFIQNQNIQSKWSQGLISNFEYLMMLNFLGGRSFNETAMYPVFPWIIKDYSSNKINLEDPSIFRDLSFPLGALNKERLNDLKKHLQDYMSFREVGFLYNSCFISPLCVYLWLIRIEPFTSLHIDLQSGRFDYATRIFTSIPAAFNMVTNHMNDYRELIPEFFYTSSFLENRNKFDLGILRGKPVDDVVLPNWCKSAIEFIYIHRKALECDYVNEHLNEWIDLIFGDSQKGQKAQERDNTFDPCLYEDIWSLENQNDETQRKMIKAVLKHCGHIPNQLFTQPHPAKTKFIVRPITESINFIPSENFPCSIFGKIFTKKIQNQGNNSIKKCLFISETGKISIAFLKTDFQTKQTFYQIISHPSIGELSSSLIPAKKRKLEKFSSTPTIKNPTATSINDSNIDPEKLQINLALANTSDKSITFAFNEKNSLLVVATKIGGIIVTQLLSDIKREIMLTKHVGHVNCVCLSDNFIVSGGSDTSINIWSSKRDMQLKKIQVEESTIPLSSSPSSSNVSNISKKSFLSLLESNKKNQSSSSNFSFSSTSRKNYKVIDDSYSSPIRHLKTIQSFRNEITCIDINEKYGTIASGTKDGSIILIDTSSLEATVTIDISPEIPMMVKITSSWGFVVVYSNKEHEGHIKSYLSVFDIDGQFIRKRQINFEISCWSDYSSLDGFDYMVIGSINPSTAFQNVKNQTRNSEKPVSYRGGGYNLYLFEVFYLDIEDAGVERSDSKFIDLKYCVKKGVLYAVTEKGSILIYSANDLNTKRFHKTVFGINEC